MERVQETSVLAIRLIAWYVAALIGFWILQILLSVLMNVNSSVGGMVAVILVAMIPGDIYFRRTGQLPSNGFGWRLAIAFALSSLCVSALQLVAYIGLGNVQIQSLASDPQFLLVLLFFHIVILGPLKWCFGWGASTRQRAVERKAAKSASAERKTLAND